MELLEKTAIIFVDGGALAKPYAVFLVRERYNLNLLAPRCDLLALPLEAVFDRDRLLRPTLLVRVP